MFEHKNSYPVILVPGIVGYGEETSVGRVLPYFGLTATSAQKVITSMGLECHTPTFGLLSGAWDRACELYAQIVGGTVDYGEAHSKKHGHARYGKTYKSPMVPNWGRLDGEGNVVKINLIAHGFGVTVARLFIELMNNGSAEEKAVTPENSLSGLFRGGFNNIIHSLVSLAGINDGITLFQALEDRIPGVQRGLVKAAIIAEELSARSGFVDTYYLKHGLAVTQYQFECKLIDANDSDEKKKFTDRVVFSEEKISDYLSQGEGNIFYDVGLHGMSDFNNSLGTHENTYYIFEMGSVTQSIMDKVTIPKLSAGILAPTAALISTYENYLPEKPIATPQIFDNDGLVNAESSMPPINEPVAAFKSANRCKPGIWYQLSIRDKNHLWFRGFGQRPDRYRNYIYDIVKEICNLDTI